MASISIYTSSTRKTYQFQAFSFKTSHREQNNLKQKLNLKIIQNQKHTNRFKQADINAQNGDGTKIGS